MNKQVDRKSDRFVSAVVFYMLGSLIFVVLIGIVPEALLVSKDTYETTVPDNASPSNYQMITYRNGTAIKSRPATEADLERSRKSERFKLKTLNIVIGGGFLLAGFFLVFLGSSWLNREPYPLGWKLAASIIMGIPGILLLVWCLLVFIGQVKPELDDHQRWTALKTGILLGGAWIIGAIKLLLAHRKSN